MRIRTTTALLVAAAVTVLALSPAAADGGDVGEIRDGTRPFRDVAVAADAGYGLLVGTPLEECVDEPGEGGMGFHHVNGDLVGDAEIDLRQPEALLYAPGPNGGMTLVGVEYVVFAEAWDAENEAPPSLLGHEFHLTGEPNRYELPPFYALHVWAWKDNPSGTFSDWNPDVSCPSGALPDTARDAGAGDPGATGTVPGHPFLALLLLLIASAALLVDRQRRRLAAR